LQSNKSKLSALPAAEIAEPKLPAGPDRVFVRVQQCPHFLFIP